MTKIKKINYIRMSHLLFARGTKKLLTDLCIMTVLPSSYFHDDIIAIHPRCEWFEVSYTTDEGLKSMRFYFGEQVSFEDVLQAVPRISPNFCARNFHKSDLVKNSFHPLQENEFVLPRTSYIVGSYVLSYIPGGLNYED